jgi:heme oxygenase
VLAHLKIVTTEWHTKTESVAYSDAIRSKTLTVPQYVDLLQKNYFLHQELEKAYLQNQWQDYIHTNLADFFQSRLARLQQDLAIHGAPLRDFPVHYHQKYRTPAPLIGHSYVVEGASMGGRVITHLLSQMDTFEQSKPFHFFNAIDAASLRERWKTFGQLAETFIQDDRDLQLAATTAVAVFQFFHAVYSIK